MAQAPAKPNVVVILADDMGCGDVRCYTNVAGQAGVNSQVDTPRIDQLAANGMRFTNAHSACGVCTPTRYALITGHYAWRIGMSAAIGAHGPSIVSASIQTLPEFMRSQGYATAMFGKWHLGANWQTTNGAAPTGSGSNVDYSQPFSGGPTDHGFDYYFGDDGHNYAPFSYLENNKTFGIPSISYNGGLKTPGYTESASLPEVTRRTVQYINQRASQPEPFFLYVPLIAPHHPITPPTSGVPADPSLGLSAFTYDTGTTSYGNFIRLVDWAAGEIVSALETQNLASNTIIVFTSDNGYAKNWSPVPNISPGFINGTLLKGQKADVYEGGTRMPMIVRWDGRVAPGSVADAVVEVNDIYGTMLDLFQVPAPASGAEDSVSMLGVLDGRAGAGRQYSVQHANNGTIAIRQLEGGNEWKLIFGSGGGGFGTPWPKGTKVDPDQPWSSISPSSLLMYNLAVDPGEMNNLLAGGGTTAMLQKAEELHGVLRGFIQDGNSQPFVVTPPSSAVLTAASEIKKSGTLLTAVNVGSDSPVTVGGITFAASSSNPAVLASSLNLSQSGGDVGATLGAGLIDSAYAGLPEFEDLLDTMAWQSGAAQAGAALDFDLTGLVAGNNYRLQLFVAESRTGSYAVHGAQDLYVDGQKIYTFDYGPSSSLVAIGAEALRLEVGFTASAGTAVVRLEQLDAGGGGLQLAAFALHDLNASFLQSGAGCPNSVGNTPTLTESAPPALGSTMTVYVHNANGLAYMAVGVGLLPVPFSLSSAGLSNDPSCLVTTDYITIVGPLSGVFGVAIWTLPVPNWSTLAGLPIHIQGINLEASGVSLTGQGVATVGL